VKGRIDPRAVAALMREGKNVIAELKAGAGASLNSSAMIEYSYDAQAGSYVARMDDPAYRRLREAHARDIGAEIARLDLPKDFSILEAGVGEATTFAGVIEASRAARALGFDISLSRLLVARAYVAKRRPGASVSLFSADLGFIPLPDAAVDVAYTSYALEPNGGAEMAMLAELLRVARRYLVLVEPSFELGGAATRGHVEKHGYVRGLPAALAALGARVLKHELWPHVHNPSNAPAVIVCEKPDAASRCAPEGFVSPISRAPLEERAGALFSAEEGFAFPIIAGIACLQPDHAILATRLKDLG
jgi:hypothetical protein